MGLLEPPDLIRVVKSADGVSIDLTGKKAGRGAYAKSDYLTTESYSATTPQPPPNAL